MARYKAAVSVRALRPFQRRSDQVATNKADCILRVGRVGRFGRVLEPLTVT